MTTVANAMSRRDFGRTLGAIGLSGLPATMAGAVGGANLIMYLTGRLVDTSGSFTAPFVIAGLLPLAGYGVVVLLADRISAFFAPLAPRLLHPVDGPIVRLVPGFRAAEQKYFADTGCYPPQHVLILRRAAWERDPSVGRRLVAVMDECEAQFDAAQRLFPYHSPWLIDAAEDTARLMGTAYHQHGLEKNRHALDVFCQAIYDDGLTKRRVAVDEIFAEFLKT